MSDLARIKRNIAKMAGMNAPEGDIDSYIASEGVSLDDVRNQPLLGPSANVIEDPRPDVPELGQPVAASPEPEPSGFMARMSEDYANRKGQIDKAVDRKMNGQSSASTALQAMGNGVGLVGDTLGNVAGSAARYADHLVPQEVDDYGKKKLGEVANYVANSDFGKGAAYLAGKGNELAKQYPTTAANLGAVGNIASALPMAKGVKVAAEAADVAGAVTSKAGQGLVKLGEKQVANQDSKFVKDLVMPKLTKAVREDQVGRTTEKGLLRSAVVEPTFMEKRAIDEVSKIPGVKDTNSLQGNYNIISEANEAEAKALKATLAASNVTVSDDVVLDTLSKIRKDLANPATHPYMIGDGAKAAENVVNSALEHINNHPRTPAGLLQARKDFDKYVKPGQFDPTVYKPANVAIQQVRQAMNQMIEDAVPTAGVKASLAKQSGLIHALDNIEEKAAAESKNRIGRFGKKLSDKVSLKNGLIGTSAALGLGGVAAANSLPVVGTLAGAYGAKKLLTSPITKKAVGQTIKKTGQALRVPNKLVN